MLAVGQDVLNLGREVKSDARIFRVQGPRDPQRVRRPIQKIGVAEHDMSRPSRNLLPDVGHDGLDRNDKHAPLVDRHDRAVPAKVLAALAGLGVAHQLGRLAADIAGIRLQ